MVIDNHEIEFTSAEISQLKLTYLRAPIFPLLFLFLFFMDNLPEHVLLIVFFLNQKTALNCRLLNHMPMEALILILNTSLGCEIQK